VRRSRVRRRLTPPERGVPRAHGDGGSPHGAPDLAVPRGAERAPRGRDERRRSVGRGGRVPTARPRGVRAAVAVELAAQVFVLARQRVRRAPKPIAEHRLRRRSAGLRRRRSPGGVCPGRFRARGFCRRGFCRRGHCRGFWGCDARGLLRRGHGLGRRSGGRSPSIGRRRARGFAGAARLRRGHDEARAPRGRGSGVRGARAAPGVRARDHGGVPRGALGVAAAAGRGDDRDVANLRGVHARILAPRVALAVEVRAGGRERGFRGAARVALAVELRARGALVVAARELEGVEGGVEARRVHPRVSAGRLQRVARRAQGGAEAVALRERRRERGGRGRGMRGGLRRVERARALRVHARVATRVARVANRVGLPGRALARGRRRERHRRGGRRNQRLALEGEVQGEVRRGPGARGGRRHDAESERTRDDDCRPGGGGGVSVTPPHPMSNCYGGVESERRSYLPARATRRAPHSFEVARAPWRRRRVGA
jgi:hypothetical protein